MHLYTVYTGMLLYVGGHTDFHIFMMVLQTLILAYPVYRLMDRRVLQKIGIYRTGWKIGIALLLTAMFSVVLYVMISIGVASMTE